MNTDIRLSVGFWEHPKTVKLTRRLGLEGVRSLQILWLWAAQNRPDGVLSGMDAEDIEIAAKWDGEATALCDTLEDLGWLDKKEDVYMLHDWDDGQEPSRPCPNRAYKLDIPYSEWRILRAAIFLRDKNICQYCGMFVENPDCDHVVPLIRGGKSEESNLVTACPSCNRSKGEKTPEEWR